MAVPSSFIQELLNSAPTEDVKPPKDHPFVTHPEIPLAQRLASTIDWLEKDKYPAHFVCQRYIKKIAGKDVGISYVHPRSTNNLTDDILAKVNQKSLLIRKLNLAAGLAYGLELPGFLNLSIAQKDKVLAQLAALIEIELRRPKDADLDKDINRFILSMAQILSNNIIGLDNTSASQKIKAVERYYVAEKKPNVMMNRWGDYTQVDIPLPNTLNDGLKHEYLKIYHTSPPQWFVNLQPWEQLWLKNKVPGEISGDWSKFESLWFPSAMQNLPGIKNIREHFLIKSTKQGSEVVTNSIKMSTLVPIEIPHDEQPLLTEVTAACFYDGLKQKAQAKFKQQWQGVKLNQLTPPILIYSLLSNTSLSQDDLAMVNTQSLAMRNILNNPGDVQSNTFIANDASNFFRFIAPDNWHHVEQLTAYATAFLKNLEGQRLTPKQNSQAMLISKTFEQLEVLHHTPTRLDRNKQAFKSAYLAILCEALGGTVSTNCKSGKDRTGLDEIYNNAMLIYYDKYKMLPRYDDLEPKRKNFREIYMGLFNTFKTHESAAANTPGSFGIKDAALVLCADIARDLGNAYQTSNQRANLNKPAPGFLPKLLNFVTEWLGNGIRWLANHLPVKENKTLLNAKKETLANSNEAAADALLLQKKPFVDFLGKPQPHYFNPPKANTLKQTLPTKPLPKPPSKAR